MDVHNPETDRMRYARGGGDSTGLMESLVAPCARPARTVPRCHVCASGLRCQRPSSTGALLATGFGAGRGGRGMARASEQSALAIPCFARVPRRRVGIRRPAGCESRARPGFRNEVAMAITDIRLVRSGRAADGVILVALSPRRGTARGSSPSWIARQLRAAPVAPDVYRIAAARLRRSQVSGVVEDRLPSVSSPWTVLRPASFGRAGTMRSEGLARRLGSRHEQKRCGLRLNPWTSEAWPTATGRAPGRSQHPCERGRFVTDQPDTWTSFTVLGDVVGGGLPWIRLRPCEIGAPGSARLGPPFRAAPSSTVIPSQLNTRHIGPASLAVRMPT
jgi:hypothetical protein